MLKQYPFAVALSICLAAGAAGALAQSALLWASGASGFSSFLHVAIAPGFTWSAIRPRLFTGVLWGAGFTPFALGGGRPLWSSLLYSILPAAFELLYLYPQTTRHGLFAQGLGFFAPVVIAAGWAAYGVGLWAWQSLCVRR